MSPVLLNPYRYGSAVSYDTAITALSPVARYKCDETSGTSATDSVGGVSGTYSSASMLGATGLVHDGGTAFNMDATAFQLTIPTSSISLTTAGTFIMWWKFTASPAGPFAANSPSAFDLTFDLTNPRIRLNGTTQSVTSALSSTYKDGARHLLALGTDGTSWEFSIDATSLWTWTQSRTFALAVQSSQPLHLGRSGSTGAFTAGVADDIAFFNTKLSMANLATLTAAA